MDSTDPSGNVYDGTTTGTDYEYNDGSLDTLSANWYITDGGSGLSGFEFAVGTSAGGNDVIDWTSAGLSTSYNATSLALQTSQVYFFSVRASDVAGNQVVISSDGQQVAPTLLFGVGGSGVTVDNLNAANSFSGTGTNTLTTSTNAHNGYTIRAFATGPLENPYATAYLCSAAEAMPHQRLGAVGSLATAILRATRWLMGLIATILLLVWVAAHRPASLRLARPLQVTSWPTTIIY